MWHFLTLLLSSSWLPQRIHWAGLEPWGGSVPRKDVALPSSVLNPSGRIWFYSVAVSLIPLQEAPSGQHVLQEGLGALLHVVAALGQCAPQALQV